MKNKKTHPNVSDKPSTSHRRTRNQAEIKVKPTQNIFRETSDIFRNLNVKSTSGISAYYHGSGPDSHFRKSLRNYEDDISTVLDNYRLFKLKKEESAESGLTNSIRKALDHNQRHNNQSARKPRSPLTVPSSDESTSSIKTDKYYTSRLSPKGDYDDLVEKYNLLRNRLLKAAESEIYLDTLTSTVMEDEEEHVSLVQEAVEEEIIPDEVQSVQEPEEILAAPEETPPEGDGGGDEYPVEDAPPDEPPPPTDEAEGAIEEPAADEPDVQEPTAKAPSIMEETKEPSIKTEISKKSENADPLTETEELVKKSSTEIDQIEQEIKPESKGQGQDFKDNAQVIKEVESCERQCMEIYGILNELKKRVGELMNKETRSDAEDRELEEKQRMLNEKMHLLEEKTRRIEQLIGQSRSLNKEYDKEHTEDILPKVIICGLTDDRSPNLIVCDEKRKRRKPSALGDTYVQDMPGQLNKSIGGQNVPTADEIQSPGNYNRCYAPCEKAGLCDGKVGPNIAYTEVMMSPQDFRQCVPNCSGKSNVGELRPPSGKMPCSARCSKDPANAPCPNMAVVPQFAKKLNESYCMQDRLAQENANLENKRYQLQTDLLNKDCTVENLQRRICSLQTDMRNVCKENTLLCDKLDKLQTTPRNRGDSCKGRNMPCGKDKGLCPADVENRLNEYNETTLNLERQLSEMETEVRTMQQEIMQVRQERLHLEQHRRMMCPQPPPAMPCNTSAKLGSPATEGQLRELREQYKTLQDDYKGKMTEVAGLRADVDKQKKNATEAEEARKLADEKIKENEKFIKQFKIQNDKLTGAKEAFVQQEQELNVAKQRYREAKDELDEVRALVDDQDTQLQDYREKYLQAQQQVEEQRRQIDLMELENNRVAEQVNLEIQRVKNQFQEKLQELTPLPDILKATQLKLQEAQQMHMLAERNNEALVRELQSYRDKAADMLNEMEKVRSDQELGANAKMSLQQRCDDFERHCKELDDEVTHLQTELVRQEDLANEFEMKAQEKMHEIAQLQAEMDNLREESARQVSRTKDRCETVRRSMQSQVADLERQLALSRAQARSAQKDRDDIRQKMQSQINNLNENFDDAQMRIRNLQGHVNFLKNSYTVFTANELNPQQSEMDPCACSPGI